MSSLPVLLVSPQALLIGGGEVAYRKAKVLIDNQIEFKVVAHELIEEFRAFDVNMVCKKFDLDDLDLFDIIIDATGDPAVAEALLLEKKNRRLLVNIAADPERSDFFFPALLNYGMLKVAVSTEGGSPTIGKVVRDEIKSFIPQGINEIIQSEARDRKAGVIDSEASRQKVLQVFRNADDKSPKPG